MFYFNFNVICPNLAIKFASSNKIYTLEKDEMPSLHAYGCISLNLMNLRWPLCYLKLDC